MINMHSRSRSLIKYWCNNCSQKRSHERFCQCCRLFLLKRSRDRDMISETANATILILSNSFTNFKTFFNSWRLRQKLSCDSYFNYRTKYSDSFLRFNLLTIIFSTSNDLTLFDFKSSFIEIDDDESRIFLNKFVFYADKSSNCAMKIIDQIFHSWEIFNLYARLSILWRILKSFTYCCESLRLKTIINDIS